MYIVKIVNTVDIADIVHAIDTHLTMSTVWTMPAVSIV